MGVFFQHSKWESTIRVVRVKLNNGERVVGVRYPVALIKFVERMMKEKSDAEQLILQAVSIYTYKVYLCCGYFTGSKYLHIGFICAAYFTGSNYLHKGSLIVWCLFWPLDPKFKLLKCSLKIYNMKVLKLNPNLILNKISIYPCDAPLEFLHIQNIYVLHLPM